MGVYTFASNKNLRTFTYKVSDLAESGEITFEGGIGISAYGQPVGGHRVNDMLGSANADLSAMHRIANLGSLPTVILNVNGRDDLVSCEISANDGKNEISDVKYEVTSEKGESLDFSGSSFKVPEGKYTLTAKSKGYVVLHNIEIEVKSDSENKFEITFEKTRENAWDGESFAQPSADENGVWQISNGAELYWYARECNLGFITNYSAVITDDIDLAGYDFEAVEGIRDAVIDGKGHTIYNVYSKIESTKTSEVNIGGIFNSAVDSIIKNLNVTGTIDVCAKSTSPTARINIGGIVGSVSSKTVVGEELPKESGVYNCNNYVDINVKSTVKVAAAIYAGGVAGKVSEISDCINYGDIYSDVESKSIGTAMAYTYSYAGGVAGKADKTERCANYGNITVLKQGAFIGGVIAHADGVSTDTENNKKIVNECYNVGTIKASAKAVGGIVGYANYATVKNCHNYGTLNVETFKTGKQFGVGGIGVTSIHTATKEVTSVFENNYYLDSTIPEERTGVSVQTATAMMNPQFGLIEDSEETCLAKDAETFADGSVLALLNGENGTSFGQKIGVNKYPIFKSFVDAVEEVEKLIDDIGRPTPFKLDKIKNARKAYDALTDTEKSMVSNYDKLVEAEKAVALIDKIEGGVGEPPKEDDELNGEGVVDIIPKDDNEFNPNTGAPISILPTAGAVIAAAAAILKKR